MEKQKIRFISTSYEDMFSIDDGEEIEIEAEDGWIRYTCRYIDEYHFSMNGFVFHIYQFALEREKYVQRYRPANQAANKEIKNDNA